MAATSWYTTYNMKYNSDILRQLHIELHDILGEVCRVCDKAKNPYFIQGGTAIGAQKRRHILQLQEPHQL